MSTAWDEGLFRLLNAGWTNAFMDVVGPALQPSWTAFVLGVAVAAPYLLRGGKRARWAVAAAILAVIVADLIAAHWLKPMVARPRPTVALEGVRMLVGRKGGFGFPSNHAANTMALAVALVLYDRRWWPAMAVIVALVGYSRVYVGVHYPLDVLGGWAVGLMCGVSSVLLMQAVERRRAGPADQSLDGLGTK